MSPQQILTHKFVDYIPSDIQDGIIYVSVEYAIAVHKCCCGCGNEVPTPLTPTDWELVYNGETVSLHPSIGNWGFPCQSHYFIKRNIVKWAKQWSREDINAGRAKDVLAKERYFSGTDTTHARSTSESESRQYELEIRKSFWQNVKRWLFRQS